MGKRRLAVSSWSWHEAYYAGRWSLLDLPSSAKAAGLLWIECNDFMLPPPRLSRLRQPLLRLLPGAPPELWRYSRATLNRLAANAHTEGVQLMTWAINSDFSVSPRHWPAQQLYLWRGLAAARRLGVALLRVNLGQADAVGDEVVAGRLAHFSDSALRRMPGLKITVENHWGISTDIDRHLRIVRQAAQQLPPLLRARFGCCFDPTNMPADDVSESERARWWRELASEANHYHFKTTAFDAEGNDTALPHDRLLGLLDEAGYQGHVAIEFQGEGDAVEAVRLSRELFKRLWSGQLYARG